MVNTLYQYWISLFDNVTKIINLMAYEFTLPKYGGIAMGVIGFEKISLFELLFGAGISFVIVYSIVKWILTLS